MEAPADLTGKGRVLTRFYHVPASVTGLYLMPFAIGNFLRVLVLGSLFDTVGRRQMIAATYVLSGLLLVVAGYLFAAGLMFVAPVIEIVFGVAAERQWLERVAEPLSARASL